MMGLTDKHRLWLTGWRGGMPPLFSKFIEAYRLLQVYMTTSRYVYIPSIK